MVNIKSTISFDEFNAIVDKVVNDCFIDNTYSPANYEISFKTALLIAFAPDFDMSDCNDNNTLWERVNSDEAIDILDDIANENEYIFRMIMETIDKAIEYRIKLLTSSPMSLTDIALSKLIDVLTDKLEKVNLPEITEEDIKSVQKVATNIESNDFTNKLVDTLFAKGVFADKENKGDE